MRSAQRLFPLLLFAAWLLPAGEAFSGSGRDGLQTLQADPSASASRRLAELYTRTTNPDQRFWIVHALGVRLKKHSDQAALEALIGVAQGEIENGVRAPALRALADYSAWENGGIPEATLARLDAMALRGIKAPNPAVREGAETLKSSLRQRRASEPRRVPPPPVEPSGKKVLLRIARVVAWLWILVLPSVVTVWAVIGLPIFDPAGTEGVRARTAWGALRRQKLFLAVTVFLWLCLSAILAGYGFDMLVLLIGRSLHEPSGGWIKAYYAAGVCVFLPGALLAAALARRPQRSAAVACLRSVPGALALWAAVFTLLLPLGVFYRILLRRGKRTPPARARGALMRMLEHGIFRSGYLASSVMACEDMGLLPALKRGGEMLDAADPEEMRIGLGAFDLRFALLCAAPVLAFFCSMISRGQPVHWEVSLPVVLLGCSLWSWAVLAGLLFAVVQALEGVAAAEFYRRSAADFDPWGEL